VTDPVAYVQPHPGRAPSRAGRVITWMVFGPLNALGLLLAANLWWLRLSGRLANEVDAAEIVLFFAFAAGAVSLLTLILAVLAVRLRWLATWWLGLPAFVLAATAIGVSSLAGHL
jgi:hypothetical protein